MIPEVWALVERAFSSSVILLGNPWLKYTRISRRYGSRLLRHHSSTLDQGEIGFLAPEGEPLSRCPDTHSALNGEGSRQLGSSTSAVEDLCDDLERSRRTSRCANPAWQRCQSQVSGGPLEHSEVVSGPFLKGSREKSTENPERIFRKILDHAASHAGWFREPHLARGLRL